MKTVIDVDIRTWADVKYFATIEKLNLNIAVGKLLERGLDLERDRARRYPG